ncbi:hypothetical protein AAULH_13411 [Lactobacillus helveticus MTCC 5463]|nr:hypothetical protein AAULH_13411 [Lactobacillus helveticus MTCC 5463]
MVENPKNVGTYYAKLTDSVAKKLRKIILLYPKIQELLVLIQLLRVRQALN